MYQFALFLLFITISSVFGVLAGVPTISFYLLERDFCLVIANLFLYDFLNGP